MEANSQGCRGARRGNTACGLGSKRGLRALPPQRQPRPLGSRWREEASPARALAGNQAGLPPRGRRLSLEGMGRWFSSPAWPLLCFLGSGNSHFLCLSVLMLRFHQIIVRVTHARLRALSRGGRGWRREWAQQSGGQALGVSRARLQPLDMVAGAVL